MRSRCEPALGVTHRRRVIAVDIAEVSLPVDQRIALREILRQPNQGVVDRNVPVRVILANHVSDDARRLFGRRFRIEAQNAHGVQQSPVNRFETIANVRQGALSDRR